MELLSSQDFRDQYVALTNLDNLNSTEVRLRFLAIGVSVLAGYLGFGVWVPVLWFCIYGFLIYFQHVYSLYAKSKPLRSTYWRLVILNFVIALIFVSLPIWLWSDGNVLYQIAGLGLAAGSVLHSVAKRAKLPLYALGDAAANCLFIIYVGASLYLELQGVAERGIVVVMFSAMIFYYVAALLDVFRLRSDLRAATQRSIESQKMQAIGQLTRGAAHDYNNILTVVMGNLELHNETRSLTEKDRLAREAHVAARRASVLTAQLLAFSRQSTLLPEAIDLAGFIDEFWQVARRVMPNTVSFKADIPRGLPKVRADRGQFEAALLNLTLNARDAMPDGGRLRISVRTIQVGVRSKMYLMDGLPIGSYLQIMISDTGNGIPDHLKSQVFDPFFTTKPFGDGSGLGLSMAKGFAEQSQGGLLLDSRTGVGTIFSLILPAESNTAALQEISQTEQGTSYSGGIPAE